jgi:hypothetical protein
MTLLVALAAPTANADDFNPSMTSCEMVYNMRGWSFLYKTMKGEGRITCKNGQTAAVKVSLTAGGLTAGKSQIIGGRGNFSQVHDIADVFGGYVTAGAHAGASVSASASVVTKGEVSLTLAGTGQGVDLGLTVGRFGIEPMGKR